MAIAERKPATVSAVRRSAPSWRISLSAFNDRRSYRRALLRRVPCAHRPAQGPRGGAAGDGESTSHPIFLTARAENPNNAKMLVLLSGAETSPEDDAFEEVLFLFDGRDAGAVAEARSRWKALKDEGRTLGYWREGEDGWERTR